MTFVGQFHEENKKIELDLLDRKILYLLSNNGRFSESSIAKSLKTSKEVIHYRMKRMQKEDFLHGFITLLNTELLGQIVHSINLFLSPVNNYEELITRLLQDERISHLKNYNSLLHIQFSVTTKNEREFVDFFDEFLNNYHPYINDYEISRILEEHFLGLDFLVTDQEKPEIIERKGPSFQKYFSNRKELPSNYKLDTVDLKILNKLKLDSRVPLMHLSKEINLATTSLQQRIKRMIEYKIIKNFIPYASFSFLGYHWFTLYLRTKNLSEVSFIAYLRLQPNVVWMSKRIGKWSYHVSVFVKNNTEFNQVVKDLCMQFKDSIIAHDSSIVYKQYKFSQRIT